MAEQGAQGVRDSLQDDKKTSNWLREIVWESIVATTTSSWISCWAPGSELRQKFPPRHSDYRDFTPPTIEEVVDAYSKYVQYGKWTFGLLEMWNPKAKYVKHAVHVPCWDSFKLNPFAWRGVIFGRTWNECLYTGFRQMRWGRAAYSGALGSEYVLPVHEIGSHGYLSDIKTLFGLYCAMSCAFSCGIGQIFSLCGNLGCNFGAWYSCHAREKLRRRYGLPSSFFLPPGIDDFLVHFFCFYCASHQELRELAVRGIDGPGEHILDVCPDSYRDAPGIDAALLRRKAKLHEMTSQPPKMFRSRVKYESARQALMARLDQGFQSTAVNAYGIMKQTLFPHLSASPDDSIREDLGWFCQTAPKVQAMKRTQSDIVSGASQRSKVELSEIYHVCKDDLGIGDEMTDLQLPNKSWSIAY